MKKFFRTKQLVAFLLIVAMLIPTTNIHTVYAAPETSGYNDTVLASLSESRVFLRAGKSKKIKCNVPIGKPGKAIITVTGEYLYGSLSCEVFVSKKISQKQAKKKLLSLKSKYPEGMSWTNENNYYYWEAANLYGYGCVALVGELSDKVFGKYAPVKTHKNFDKIKVGDHVRIGNYHSVIVLKKSDNSVTVVEGNYNASVHWNRVITKRELKQSGFHVDTRY